MARNKMEKEFADRLNQREIKPSAAAWDRLDAMLASTEAQPKVVAIKRNYKWLYIAAGLLGFLFLGTLFFKQDANVKIAPDTEIANENAKPQTPSIVDSVQKITPKTEIASTSGKAETQKPSVKKAHSIVHSDEKQPQLAHNDPNENHQPQIGESIISQKTLPDPTVPTGQNADELLAAAQSKREESKKLVKINARNLLLQVDSQAEEKLTPRQRALRALNRNYQHVKVAVENRNYDESH